MEPHHNPFGFLSGCTIIVRLIKLAYQYQENENKNKNNNKNKKYQENIHRKILLPHNKHI
jgi:hypothetical protein